MLNLLIRNGTVFDGLGSPPLRGDVGIRDGRIARIAPRITAPSLETVDGDGLWVMPGFLDIHTHYDLEVEIAPGLAESARHGVTTVVMGNCSLSLTIGTPDTLADIFLRVENVPRILVRKWLRQSASWSSPAEYFDHLRRLNLGPNVAALLGHSPLRAEVMGLERSLTAIATDDELWRMKQLALEALDAGCIGISVDMVPWHMMSGLFRGRPIPSQHADFREYKLLADLCRERDAVFQVTPNPQNLASLWHILRLSLGRGRSPLRITVLAALDSVADRRLWRVLPPTLDLLNYGLGCNIRFQTLTEPFTVYSDGPLTPLFEEFPSGTRLNNVESRQDRQQLWRSPEFRAQFARDWSNGWRKTFHRDLALMKIVESPDRSLESKTIEEVARTAGRDPVEVLMELLARYDADLRWVSTGANDRLGPRLALMRHPFILPGFTDAGAHVRNLGYYDGALSLLKQAICTGFMSPERAIHRVTGEPAQWFRLDTGVLKEGAKADLVLIHPEHLKAPLSEQVAIQDPLLDGALRMVKRGSGAAIHSVYIRGEPVYSRRGIAQVLGRQKLGDVLTLPGVSGDRRRERAQSRNRINDKIDDHPFTDYWEIFVLKHQHPANVALHMLGVVLFYSLLVAAWMTRSPWWLCLLPLSQLIGLTGHYLFEKSHIDLQDAIFSVRASRCLNKMFLRVLLRKYGQDIREVNERLRVYQASWCRLGPSSVVSGASDR